MNRRGFLEALGGVGMRPGRPGGGRYLLQIYRRCDTSQLARLHRFTGTGNLLEAFAAAHLPQYATLRRLDPLWEISPNEAYTETVVGEADGLGRAVQARVFELRQYGAAAGTPVAALQERCLSRCGIYPMFRSEEAAGRLTYLIPFGSLAARGQAWAAVSSDPEWGRARRLWGVTQISLFEAVSDSSFIG